MIPSLRKNYTEGAVFIVESDLFDALQEEKERIRDQQEKAQLERNMRERDAANTRKVIIQLADTSCLVSISFGEQTDYSRRVEKYIPNENTEDHKIKI